VSCIAPRLLLQRVLGAVTLVVAFAATVISTSPLLTQRGDAGAQSALVDLATPAALRAQYNHNRGQVRLVLLLSPT
jgi:hypothetical protein